MASSSSSSHVIPASSSQSWNHDVFLSFRGEDTRKTFVDHLYSALVKQGIHTYKDDETLPRGECIGPSLLKAIRESRIAVIVLSENYANSSWCLDELAYIMECMDVRGQIVMPIFYDVDPSDVRKQKGKYGDAFAKHELENSQKVDSWRKALANVGNLSGWVPKDIANGHEAKFINEVVRTISSRLAPFVSNVNKDIIGMETRLQDIKSMLEIGSSGVCMVGIWGVGGGGKTTLACATYVDISHQFEARCLLENIREESSKHGLKTLQQKMLSVVLTTEHLVVNCVEEGKCMIRSRLCHKNVLIVLDDVDNLEQLEALAGSHDWFGEGSRIIITTRDEHLLSRTVDVIYGMNLLSQDEAIELFRRHAYRDFKPVEDYDTLSLAMVSYADGLPLALKVLGSFLYDKDKDEWMATLAKLRDIPNPRIMDKLKISFDGLEPDEKELFLDIACFLRGRRIDNSMTMLTACSFYPVIGVKVLVQKSLITVSNGIFDMHDLVQEMAAHIVRGEYPKRPEMHSRVWQRDDIKVIGDVDTKKENDKIEAIILPIGFTNQRYSEAVANMKNLRWLYWSGPTYPFPANFQPTKLRYLVLCQGTQRQVWQGFKYLPNLKMLDVRSSQHLTKTPDFSGLPVLERLILKRCYSLKEIHPSIGYHERLVFIDMKDCSQLKRFPPIIQMRKLETLKLSWCFCLRKFPDIHTTMDSLIKLRLNKTRIKIVPSSVGKYCTNLVSLDFRDCDELKRIEGSFHSLKYLKELHLEGCWELENLPENFFDVECCLEVLSLSTNKEDSSSLKNRMKQFVYRDLASIKIPHFPFFLKRLTLSHCHLKDGDLPSDICELSNLELLDLRGNYFSRLHFSLSQLSCLKLLNMSECTNLLELPDLPSSIAVLKACDCDSLASIGNMSNYKYLWKVSFWRRNKLVGGERVVHSMLQVEDRIMSVTLAGGSSVWLTSNKRTFTLQLPHNWYKDFSGFIIYAGTPSFNLISIVIKQDEKCIDSQPDHWEEFDKNPEFDECAMVGYVPFGLLRLTSWWNPSYTKLSFELNGRINPKVGLVPRKIIGDSKPKGVMHCSQVWDDELSGTKTFFIREDTKSFIEIFWSPYF